MPSQTLQLKSLQDPVGSGDKATTLGVSAGNAGFLLYIEGESCMRPLFKDAVLLQGNTYRARIVYLFSGRPK